ncbi:ATP-binding cassette domain-containing protein [Paenibacillus tyrfis]|uniref:ATP-binding cassette domain-containing protein n=1 Tax=Paenibacillus tyrfis TaxID=1501230 RepID=UPI001F2F4FB3|nr:ATP-binding cassette domain-containing protein [Paenibacillus tyrfis]
MEIAKEAERLVQQDFTFDREAIRQTYLHLPQKKGLVRGNGKLATQLYEGYEGQILVNGEPASAWDVEQVQKRIGVVFQDFVQYEMTVRNNIGLGNTAVLEEDDKLLAASDRTGIGEFVRKLPKQLNTELGHWVVNGEQLSGASGSGSPSRGPSSARPICTCWTSRTRRLTQSPRAKCLDASATYCATGWGSTSRIALRVPALLTRSW